MANTIYDKEKNLKYDDHCSRSRDGSPKLPADFAINTPTQPLRASKALRFRCECEGRFMGILLGQISTPNLNTYPTIEIVGFKGRSTVVVSCVTKDAPYRPHPYNLVGKENCKKGVCTVEIDSDTMCTAFENLSIQCVKKRDIEQSLRLRQNIRVDLFRTGFAHSSNLSCHELNCVRLCFQVFLANEMQHYTIPLPPVVSAPVYNKRFVPDLNIVARRVKTKASKTQYRGLTKP
ncbi:embryonic polarity protein dorsal-like [Ceratitis capitata]|uniref:embryonic polarity protein dorsal-like n=1 Tax=Ceratitis capitata TaxID=7213 RepID=UPI000618874F|nr:embryonic polarity protein dorsal-like [Ceratitis capitata]